MMLILATSTSVNAQTRPVGTSENVEKLMNYPVSLSTGIAQIEIPLYNIDFSGMNIPITLSYHPSGLKLTQKSGIVGAGWSLSAQHQISRTVRGREDEFYPMPPQVSNMNFEQLNGTGGYYSDRFNSKEFRDIYLAKFMLPDPNRGGSPSTIYPSVFQTNDYYDSESDIFRYNLFGNSGKFLFTYRNPYMIKLLDSDMYNPEFQFIQRPDNDSYFTVKDDKGIRYKFGDNGMKQWFYNGSNNLNTSWVLNSVHALNGDSVVFDYWFPHIYEKNFGKSIYIQEGCKACFPYSGNVPSYFSQNSNTPSYGQDVAPRSITFAEGILEYSYIYLYPGGISESLVDEMNVTDLDGNSIKKVKFFYHSGVRFVLLDSIKISGGNEKPMVYRFDYQSKDELNIAFDSIPLQVDLWGYVSKQKNFIAGSLKTDIPFSNNFLNLDVYDYVTGGYRKLPTFFSGIKFDDKSVFPEVPAPYTLTKITYPTGGSTNYIYEINKSGWGLGSGYRIKEISTLDDYSGKKLRRTFQYQDENGNEGRGYLVNYRVQTDNYSVEQGVAVGVKPDNAGQPVSYILYNTYNISNQSKRMDLDGLDENPVYYVKIIEQTFNGINPIAKTVHNYESLEYDVMQYKHENRNQMPNIAGRGSMHRGYRPDELDYIIIGYFPKLLEKTEFVFFQNQWKKTATEKFTYTAKPDAYSLINNGMGHRNLRISNYAKMTPDYSGGMVLNSIYDMGNIDSFFDFNRYYILPTPKRLLLSKSITTYSK